MFDLIKRRNQVRKQGFRNRVVKEKNPYHYLLGTKLEYLIFIISENNPLRNCI